VAFSNINAVSLLYPTFQRGVPNQKPSDTLIQQFINDAADMITAILERRFNEAISAPPFNGNVNLWLISMGVPDINWQPSLPVNMGDIVVDLNDPMAAQQAQNAGITGSAAPAFSAIYGTSVTDNVVVWTNIGQSRQFRVLERGDRFGAAAELGSVMASFGVASALNLAKEHAKVWNSFQSELNSEKANGEPKTFGVYDFMFDNQASVQTPRPILTGIAGGDQPRGVAPDCEGVSAVFGKFGRDYGWHSRRRWN
jgi:hypothetical protein